MPIRIGLIVNPVAGLGGTLAQKGSDAADIRELARRAGVDALAADRARVAVQRLLSSLEGAGKTVQIFAGAADMGSDALGADIAHEPVSAIDLRAGASTSFDTKAIAQQMV